MMSQKQANEIIRLGDAIDASRHLCVFSGAGISCPSGIPDFRSENGLYRQKNGQGRRPEEIISHSFFCAHPEEFYAFYREKMVYPDAEPNAAHRYFAALEEAGKRVSVVTQNIDGLHQAAGSREVYELHGSVHRNYCTRCGRFYDLTAVLHMDGLPRCPIDGAIIKPDVVLYEEPLDETVVTGAVRAIAESDTMIVVGTSLVVYPAAAYVQRFRGRMLALVNLSETPYDGQADLAIHGDVVDIVEALNAR